MMMLAVSFASHGADMGLLTVLSAADVDEIPHALPWSCGAGGGHLVLRRREVLNHPPVNPLKSICSKIILCRSAIYGYLLDARHEPIFTHAPPAAARALEHLLCPHPDAAR